MNELSLYLILAAILGQGLFLMFALRFLPKRNKYANRVLSIILLIANVMLLGRIAVGYYGIEQLHRIATLMDGTIYIFGPLFYGYIRRLLFIEKSVYHLSFVHYIPVITYSLFYVWVLTIPTETLVTYRGTKLLSTIYASIEGSGIFSMSFYIIRSISLLKTSKKRAKEQYASNSPIYQFLTGLMVTLCIFCSLWMVNFTNEYILDNSSLRYFGYGVMWISMGGLIYFLGFYSLSRPEVFMVHKIKEQKNAEKSNRLSSEEIQTLQRKLEIALEEHQLYLDSKISLVSLSKAIETTPNNLSWLLNNIYEKKFYVFINEYRVRAFLKLIRECEHKNTTLFALAIDVGFNSKSTFNNAFKLITNQTPSAYIKQHESRFCGSLT